MSLSALAEGVARGAGPAGGDRLERAWAPGTEMHVPPLEKHALSRRGTVARMARARPLASQRRVRAREGRPRLVGG